MYTDILRLFLADGKISPFERRELIRRAHRLQIDPQHARELEEAIRSEFGLPSLKQLQHFAWRVESLLLDRELSEEDGEQLRQLANAYRISQEEAQQIITNTMARLKMNDLPIKDIL